MDGAVVAGLGGADRRRRLPLRQEEPPRQVPPERAEEEHASEQAEERVTGGGEEAPRSRQRTRPGPDAGQRGTEDGSDQVRLRLLGRALLLSRALQRRRAPSEGLGDGLHRLRLRLLPMWLWPRLCCAVAAAVSSTTTPRRREFNIEDCIVSHLGDSLELEPEALRRIKSERIKRKRQRDNRARYNATADYWTEDWLVDWVWALQSEARDDRTAACHSRRD